MYITCHGHRPNKAFFPPTILVCGFGKSGGDPQPRTKYYFSFNVLAVAKYKIGIIIMLDY